MDDSICIEIKKLTGEDLADEDYVILRWRDGAAEEAGLYDEDDLADLVRSVRGNRPGDASA